MGGFLPPVIFQIQANATQALASFAKVNAQLTAMEAQALKTGVALTRMNKALVLSTAVLKTTAIAFVALAAWGIKSNMDIEKSYSRLGQAMANQGLATKENLAATSELVNQYESLGFGSEKAADAYNVLITATGDMTKSNHLLALSADLARSKNMSLEAAASQLVRASNGAGRVFKQFGITLDATKPKAEATAEAMGKLEAKLKGQAEAYAKTTAGQLSIMKEQIGDIGEAIGNVALPAFNKFLSGIRAIGKFLADHKLILLSIATGITIVLIPAVVLLTKKLYAQAVAFAAANWEILAIAAVIVSAGAAFVWAWNKFEGFRKLVVNIGKAFITFGQVIVETVVTIVNGFLLLVRGTANVQIALGKLFNNKEMVKTGQSTLTMIDDFNAKAKTLIGSFDTAKKKLDGLVGTKIDLSKFKLGVPQIKEVENGAGGIDDTTAAVKELAEALLTARQRALDFKNAMIDTAKEIYAAWKTLVRRDIKDAIRFGLLDPVDQLVESTTKLMSAYTSASSVFASANSGLVTAQKAYEKAVQGTDKALIASTESALKRAEEIVTKSMDNISGALENLATLQDQIVSKIVSLYQEIADLQKERIKVIADGQLEETKLTKEHLITLAELHSDYDKKVAEAQTDASKRSAELVKQSIDQLRGVYRSATSKTIGDIFSALTFEGKYLKGGTIEKLLGALGLQTGKAKVLADDAAKLSGLGFTQTFIEQVVAQGPDVGHQLAQTIISATPASQKSLQEYWTALDKQSQHGVDAIATQMNSGITLATEELTAQLAQVGKDLTAQLAGFTKELVDATAAQVADYAEKLKQIRDLTKAAVADIDASISKKRDQIDSLGATLDKIAGAKPPSTNALVPFIPTEDLPKYPTEPLPWDTTQPPPVENQPYVPTPNAPVTTSLAKSTTSTSKYVVKPGDTLSAIAKANDISLTKLLADNPKFTEVDKYKGGNMIWAGTTVNIKTTTNATAQSIASDVGWAIRTSSDVQYGSSVTSAPDYISYRAGER